VFVLVDLAVPLRPDAGTPIMEAHHAVAAQATGARRRAMGRATVGVSGGGRRRRGAYRVGREWDGPAVRALRHHLGLTQEELSARLGMRQQTVSEWEIGKHRPRGASRTLLTVIAEGSGFYAAGASPAPGDDAPPAASLPLPASTPPPGKATPRVDH
jgi:hypothetical protein